MIDLTLMLAIVVTAALILSGDSWSGEWGE